VELANTGEQAVPVGPGGLFTAVVFLNVTIGPGEVAFPELTTAVLPAPGELAGGQAVSTTVRVDVGGLETYLTSRPAEALTLTVAAVLDPEQVASGRGLRSTVPGVKVTPAEIVRRPLLPAEADDDAVARSLEELRGRLRGSKPQGAILAARQLGSLLAAVRVNDTDPAAKLAVPAGLKRIFLLDLLAGAVGRGTTAARAETAAVLHFVPLSERMIGALAPAIQDRSPVVRMRLIDLLAAKQTPGYRKLVQVFSRDADEDVRRMAELYAPARRSARPGGP
jgi:hypothetical protein